MNSFAKLKEWTKEEIHEQIINGDIDHDFICEYISSRDRVYNKLIDRVNELESVLKEIREYIFNTYDDVITAFAEDKPMTNFKARTELLEIIDKEIRGNNG